MLTTIISIVSVIIPVAIRANNTIPVFISSCFGVSFFPVCLSLNMVCFSFFNVVYVFVFLFVVSFVIIVIIDVFVWHIVLLFFMLFLIVLYV